MRQFAASPGAVASAVWAAGSRKLSESYDLPTPASINLDLTLAVTTTIVSLTGAGVLYEITCVIFIAPTGGSTARLLFTIDGQPVKTWFVYGIGAWNSEELSSGVVGTGSAVNDRLRLVLGSRFTTSLLVQATVPAAYTAGQILITAHIGTQL